MLSILGHPLLGVGNGIQGFYYIKYFPSWGFGSYESAGLFFGDAGWPGSGAFLPTYLSAFGAFGVLLLVLLSIRIAKNIKRFKYLFLSDFLTMSLLSLFFQFYTTYDIIGNYAIVFILSLAACGTAFAEDPSSFEARTSLQALESKHASARSELQSNLSIISEIKG
jgi:hypothetical protein